MTKYKIVYKKSECVGAGECEALSPEFWKMQNDGKANLVGAVFNEAIKAYELFIDDSSLKKQKLVVGSCPVGCIKVHEL